MRILVVKSDNSDVPLAEVRVQDDQLEFIVDNTNGQIPSKVGKSLAALQRYIKNSSHMTLEQPQKTTVNLLRYVFDNGDVAEITTDGHTVVLNGKLLSPEEKDALFVAIKRGDIKVSRKTDIQQALPIMPTSAPMPEQKPIKTSLNPEIIDMIKKEQERKAQMAAMSNSSYDDEIENSDLSGSEDADWTKKMLYFLKYGSKK